MTNSMLTQKARTIEAKTDLQTKIVFWVLFVESRGGTSRIRNPAPKPNLAASKPTFMRFFDGGVWKMDFLSHAFNYCFFFSYVINRVS